MLVTGLPISCNVPNGRIDSSFDAAANCRRVAAGNDVAKSFAENRTSQYCRGRRSVASQIGCLLSDFDDELRTHVLEAIFQIDFFGDGDAVLGDGWSAEGFVDDHVSAGRTHRDCHGVRKFIDALQHLCRRGLQKEVVLPRSKSPYNF